MSTTATSTSVQSPSVATSPSDELISQRITEACKALWWAEIIRRVLLLVIVCLLAMLSWLVIDQWIYESGKILRSFAWGVMAVGCVWYTIRRIVPVLRSSVRPEYAARSLERDLPEMRQELTSYVTLRPESAKGGLRSRVVLSIGAIAAGRLRSHDVLPTEATGTMRWWIAAAGALALLAGYVVMTPKNAISSASRLIAPLASIEPSKRVSISNVQPGNAEAIAGRTLLVSASVDGLADDEPVLCRWETPSNQNEFILRFDESMQQYIGELELDHSAAGQIPYTIVAGDDAAGPFWLSVQNVPVVAIQSVHYDPPPYTGEVPHTSSSAAITGVDGTKVTIRARTNRPIAKARIEFNPKALGESVRATAGFKSMLIDEDQMTLSISFPLSSSRGRTSAVQLESYRLRVWDAAEQSNPDPIVYPIRVIEDLPPEVSIVMPRKTPKSMGIHLQQTIEVHAMDPDFGLKKVELEIRRGIDVIRKPVLWSDEKGVKGNRVTEYRFRPTEYDLRVGDVVQLVAVATDNRFLADNKTVEPNRTVTDPIELRIVGDETDPDPEGEDDGLSETDQRPATEQSQDDGDQGNSGKSADQNGGDKKGGGGGGSEGAAGESQEGAGESGENGGSGKGQTQNKSDKAGEMSRQQGDGQPGDEGDESTQSSSQDGVKSNGEGTASGNQSKGGQQKSGQPNRDGQPNPGQSPADQPNGDQSGGDQQSTADPGDNQPSDGQNMAGSENGGQKQGDQPSGDESGQPNAGERGDSHGQTADSQNSSVQNSPADRGGDSSPGTGAEEDGAHQGPPKHDGETFERIRDHIEEKRRESDQQTPSPTQPNNGQGDSQSSQEGGSSQNQPGQQPNDSTAGDNSTAGDKGAQDSDGNPSDSKGDGTGGQKGNGSKPDADGEPNGKDDAGQKSDGGEKGQGEGGASEGDELGKQTGENRGDQESIKQSDDGSQSDSEARSSEPSDGAGKQGADESKQGEKASDQSQEGSGSGSDKGNNPSGSKGDSAEGQGSERGSQKGAQGEGSGNGETDQSDSAQGDSAQSDSQGKGEGKGGDSAAGKPGGESGSKSESGGKPNDAKSGESSSDGSQSGSPSEGDNAQGQSSEGTSQASPPSDSNSKGGNASGAGSSTGSGASGDGAPPPEAPDMEYTKKATDMVLDYLEETRDAPDTELLEKLNWTEQDLKRFADRWQKTRELQKTQPGDQTSKEIQEALESLGMRPGSAAAGSKMRDNADDLRSIRDSGNRKPAPAAYRDIFDAFRRGQRGR